MIHSLLLRLTPQQASDQAAIQRIAGEELTLSPTEITAVRVIKRSIDARQRQVMINLTIEVYIGQDPPVVSFQPIEYPCVKEAPSVVVVGAGPAGLFAALQLIELGVRPIVVERGKNVRDRKRDVALISRTHHVDADSNYSFGEGGAGAFSDGKLYTRSKKRGSIERILQLFCQFGADSSILTDAHPHIGTDKLPRIIENIRHQIIASGGEVHFEQRMERLLVDEDEVKGIVTHSGGSFLGKVILATGHSARDVYRYLHATNPQWVEAKSIAMGVRVEHVQQSIDVMQYHQPEGRGAWLPPAEYSLVTQVEGRGVYSFCMCPGGTVVPAATGPQQVVVNGMSSSSRGGKWANSGLVVEIHPQDIAADAADPLAVMRFQEEVEAACYRAAEGKQTAPAQRIEDFIARRLSTSLPPSSYAPGLLSSPLHTWLPSVIDTPLRAALGIFRRTHPLFVTNEAVMIAVESRTSSPVRIPRHKESLQHLYLSGLYPCGEGAGYAGGIVSAAIDGERCAQQCAQSLL